MIPRLVLLLGLVVFCASEARAQTCNASITDLSFGSVDTLEGGDVDSTATVEINCSGIGLLGVRVCPYLGDGSGGRDGSSRYMASGGDTLAYDLFTDAGHGTVWGSATLGFGSFPTVDFTGNVLGTGTGSTTLTIHGRVFAGQNAAPPATYISNFTAAHTEFRYGINVLGLISCSTTQLLTSEINPTFTVDATVDKNCLIGTSDVAFATQGVLLAEVAAVGGLDVQCTPTTAYSIALDNGMSGTGPTTRLMKKGAETISYGLYKDSGHSQPWGSIGGDVVGGTGTGSVVPYDVFGRVPPQTTPSPGLYQDTVVATVTY